MGITIATFMLVKIPLVCGYYVIGSKILGPVIEGVIYGVKDGIKAGKAELRKKKEEKKD